MQEWKQRKKIKYRVISAKRKLSELGQNHVLEGLKIGEKDQRRFLAGQIAEINFKLLQCSLESIRTPIERLDTFIHLIISFVWLIHDPKWSHG